MNPGSAVLQQFPLLLIAAEEKTKGFVPRDKPVVTIKTSDPAIFTSGSVYSPHRHTRAWHVHDIPAGSVIFDLCCQCQKCDHEDHKSYSTTACVSEGVTWVFFPMSDHGEDAARWSDYRWGFEFPAELELQSWWCATVLLQDRKARLWHQWQTWERQLGNCVCVCVLWF